MPRPSQTVAALTNRIAGVIAILATCATCDASSLMGPAGVEDLVISYEGDTLGSSGATIVPRVSVTVGGQPLADPRLTYTSSDPSIIQITPEGALYLGKLGKASVTVSIRSSLMPSSAPTASWNFHVVAESLSVSAAAVSFMALGRTAVIAASAFDFNGAELANPPIRWESSNPDVAAVTQSGIVTAKGPGTASIRAILGPDTATVTASVEQVLAGYTLSHDDVTLEALGDTLRISVSAHDANGSLIVPSPATAPVWGSRDPNTVDVNATGKISARRNGSTWIIAQRGTVADSVRANVNQAAVRAVIASAAGYSIDAVGGQLTLAAQGFDRNNNPDVNSLPVWASLNPAGARVDPVSGLVTGLATGDHRIVATIDNAADTVVVNVNNAPASIDLAPATLAMTSVNDTAQLVVATYNSRGDRVAAEVNLRSTDTAIVRIVENLRIEARAVGTARVIASASGLADTAVVTVTNDPRVIDLHAAELALTHLGKTSSPAVTIRNARGDVLPRTAVTWRSTDATIASVSAHGLVTALKEGSTVVYASAGALVDSIRVTVTNAPYSIVLSAQVDTMTGSFRYITFTGDVRNEVGALITPYTIVWRSTATNIATVSSAGVVTSMQNGTALIIGEAGTVADTILIIVRNPTLLWVDNSVVVNERFGTFTRPYARIQDAINAADAGDTVVVRRGSGYAESLALSRRITLLGDSAAYVAGGRDPALLPAIAHDTGTAGIAANTTAQLIIRYFALTHSLDGPAINTSGADVRIDNFHVNPGSSTIKLGRGILVRDAPTFAVLADITVMNVRGYGIRLERVTQGQVDRVMVQGVDSVSGTRGAGIDVYRGSINDVRSAFVRDAQGPGVMLDSTSSASVVDSRFVGRTVQIRARGVSGSITAIDRNVFDLAGLPNAADTRSSANDGRSGLEITSSSNVQVRENLFVETGTSLMDGIRLIGAKGGGAFLGVTIFRNRFIGGRYNVRSERSSWTMTESHSAGAVTPIFATEADTIQLVSDTLVSTTGDACINSSGLASRIDISGGLLAQCGPPNGVGGRAIRATGTSMSLVVRGTTMGGPNQTAVHFNGRDLTLRGNRMSGKGTRTVSGFVAAGVVDATVSGATTISANTITDYNGLTAAVLSVGSAVVDSNIVARNGTGFNFVNWQAVSAVRNDLSDHELMGVRNGRSSTLTFTGNWWGDARGPRRTTAPAATGDSAGALVSFGTVDPNPLNAGTTAYSIRSIRGSGQTGTRGTVLPQAFTVRVVDDQGRPVSGTTVSFTVTDGNGSVSVASATTNSSGLAEATLTLGMSPGGNAVTATIVAPGSPTSVTFTATGT